MQKKYFKNSIISFVTAGIILMPYLGITQTAYAQYGGSTNNTNYGSGNGGYSGGNNSYQSGGGGGTGSLQSSIKLIAPAITKLPGCKGKISSGIKSLFGSSNAVPEISGAQGDNGSQEKLDSDKLAAKAQSAGDEANSIPIFSLQMNQSLTDILGKTSATAKSTGSQDEKTSCMNSIGRMVTGLLLQKLTMSTVDWINHGFEGKPLYIQDPQGFFTDIAKNEILQFGFDIKNPKLFPFGEAFMINQALAFQRKFADNAQYSLDKMISDTTPQYTSASFSADFSAGGWNAWNSMTQIPANNPIGFQVMASDELSVRLAGTQKSNAQNTRDSLQQSGGFLGQERCASNHEITRESQAKALAEGNPHEQLPGDEPGSGSNYDTWNQNNICQQWEYVTPGKMVAEAATKSINYPDNKLLSAQDLNDAEAAILDAVMNRFATQIMDKTSGGFAGASSYSSGNSPYDTSNAGDYTTQVQKDFPDGLATSSWLSENPDFNIRFDLTQAMIDDQRIYITKLEDQNKELISNVPVDDFDHNVVASTDTNKNYGLLPTIYQLDYCIPGPHPGWEQDSQAVLDLIKSKIVNTTGLNYLQIMNLKPDGDFAVTETALSDDKFDSVGSDSGFSIPVGSLARKIGKLWASIGQMIGVLGPDSIDSIKKMATGTSWTESFNRIIYSTYVEAIAGMPPIDRGTHLQSYDQAETIFDKIFSRYQDVIHTVTVAENMPGVSQQANAEFEKSAGYRQLIENNKKAIALKKNIVQRLVAIKDGVDTVKNNLDPQSQTYDADLTIALRPWISAFGRLSADMVTGNDIAKADNLVQEIKDKKISIYNDLLKGVGGCEADMAKAGTAGFFIPAYLKTRQSYPLPHFYDYSDNGGFLKNGIYTGTPSAITSINDVHNEDIHVTDMFDFGTPSSGGTFLGGATGGIILGGIIGATTGGGGTGLIMGGIAGGALGGATHGGVSGDVTIPNGIPIFENFLNIY